MIVLPNWENRKTTRKQIEIIIDKAPNSYLNWSKEYCEIQETTGAKPLSRGL